ncbi:MAG TPA: DeoR family transcriptional regulator [Bacillales bacterium]|nr:DeoR family transcriptional regulator [Bacillales bacterium]
MLPAERRKKIKEWIETRQNLKITELSEKLGVSEMTIHRDVKTLVDEGLVVKTFGGISLAKHTLEQPASKDCVYCKRRINEILAFRFILDDDRIETACCAHCGMLRQLQLGDQVIQALCRDFLRHTTISAATATFVMDTSLEVGCCQPQVLAFERETDARKFINGFGGTFYSFSDAVQAVQSKMNVHI